MKFKTTSGKAIRLLVLLLSVTITLTAFALSGYAEDGGDQGHKAKRTILLYDCGADLETSAGMATYNLEQILKASFSKDEDIRFLVLTGGSNQWQLDKDYLYDPSADADHQPQEVSNRYNQIWEAKGLDAAENPGKMVLLDADGVMGDGDKAKESKDELMSDPETLKAFINYGVDYPPAEKYDLILWDHGAGQVNGFAIDEHEPNAELGHSLMSFSKIVDALSDNKVIENGGKFDFVDFDACLMNSIELDLVLADYMDYYIASPESEPGYGQYYTGWLNMLGEAPGHDVDTLKLGQTIVDDFYEFYDSGDGEGQDGTLAVIDMNKMLAPETGLVSALEDLNTALKGQVQTDGKVQFYDEFLSLRNSISYGSMDYYDLGNVAALLSVENTEVVGDNPYGDACTRISGILQKSDYDDPNDKTSFIYARGTEEITTDMQLYRKADGELDYDSMGTSGIFLFFPFTGDTGAMVTYYDEMGKVLETMPKDDPRRTFLDHYRHTMIDYALIAATARDIGIQLNVKELDKSEVDYSMLKAYWQEGLGDEVEDFLDDYDYKSFWDRTFKPLFEARGVPEAETDAWLSKIVDQQVDEALTGESISAKKIKSKNGDSYQLTIRDARRPVIGGASWGLTAELPAFEKYFDDIGDEDIKDTFGGGGYLDLGSIEGQQILNDQPDREDYADLSEYQKALQEWYDSETSTWELGEIEQKWYAVKDADGKLHVTDYEEYGSNGAIVPGMILSEDNLLAYQVVILFFENDKLSEIGFLNSDTGLRYVKPKDIVGELEIMSAKYVDFYGMISLFVPISESTFKLSAQNADEISLVYEDVDKITDIADKDGDGEKVGLSASVYDIYDCSVSISDKLEEPEQEVADIGLARIKPGIYTGETLEPEVIYLGETLVKGVDYEYTKIWDESTPEPQFIEPGEYQIQLVAKEGSEKVAGIGETTFFIVRSEEAVQALIDEAERDLEAAQTEMQAAIESGDQQALTAAYTKLVNAQNALTDAMEEMQRTKDVLSEEEQAELEDEIAKLELKVEELNDQLAEAMVIDITNYAVTLEKTSYEYTGEEIEPEVSVAGLSEDDYMVEYSDNVRIGTAKVTITALSENYKGSITKTFKITKMTTPLAVKAKTAKVKYSKLKKKAQKLPVTRVIKFTKRGQGTMKYTLSTAKKGKKSFKKYFKINKKTGKVTVKKGLKKGTYKVKVKVRAAGNSTYKPSAVKTVTFTIKVK